MGNTKLAPDLRNNKQIEAIGAPFRSFQLGVVHNRQTTSHLNIQYQNDQAKPTVERQACSSCQQGTRHLPKPQLQVKAYKQLGLPYRRRDMASRLVMTVLLQYLQF